METSYEKKQRLDKESQQVREKIQRIKLKLKEVEGSKDIIQLSETLLPFLTACGCEEKLLLLDLSETSIKLHTRVPMDYLIFPGRPYDAKENPQLHQYAMRSLFSFSFIKNIKWIPHPDGSNVLILADFEPSN